MATEGDENKVVDELSRMAQNKDEHYIDSLAVFFIIRKKLGDRNADLWLTELKEVGLPVEWQSLTGGAELGGSDQDLEHKIKSFVGASLYRSKLSLKDRWRKRSIEKALVDRIEKTYMFRSSMFVSNVYRLVAIYSLSGNTSLVGSMFMDEKATQMLPAYVHWIQKFMWGLNVEI